MSDREKLLADFIDAALKLMQEGLSGLTVENALLVARAQQMGADVVLVFAPGAGTVVGGISPTDRRLPLIPLFKIPADSLPSEVSTN